MKRYRLYTQEDPWTRLRWVYWVDNSGKALCRMLEAEALAVIKGLL